MTNGITGTDADPVAMPPAAAQRPPFIAAFIGAVHAHQRAQVHSMLVAQATEIVVYIEELERKCQTP